MKTFQEWFKANRSEEFPEGDINGSWFVEHNIPMVVQCTCCDMTLCVVNAHIDNYGNTFCGSCSEYYDDGDEDIED